MLKRSLLILLIFFIQGCVGTMRLAQESNPNTVNTNEPAVAKPEIKEK